MRLAMTGLGLMSSIGHGAAPACAALRAGISRPSPLDWQGVDEDRPEAYRVTGHPVRLLAGLPLLSRLSRLGAWALADVLGASELERASPEAWSGTVLLPCLSPGRTDDAGHLDTWLAEELRVRLVLQALSGLPVRCHAPLWQGHAAALAGVRAAARLLEAGEAERVVVLGVDSLVTPEALAWLSLRRWLKTPDRPVGLMPGEAAAAVVLEPERAARRRGAPIQGYVEAVDVAAPGGEGAGGPPALGRRLAELLLAVWPAGVDVGDVYGDLNGQEHRAAAWGHACVPVREARPGTSAAMHLPASCLGDTGAASGAVALCAAARAFVRRYARGASALVFSMGDAGDLAAARVSGP